MLPLLTFLLQCLPDGLKFYYYLFINEPFSGIIWSSFEAIVCPLGVSIPYEPTAVYVGSPYFDFKFNPSYFEFNHDARFDLKFNHDARFDLKFNPSYFELNHDACFEAIINHPLKPFSLPHSFIFK